MNHLSSESSPYLLQHAGNPVDWYPWGPEALEKAKTEDRPIFLSIGYSACHWCHVMERESFEDERTAALLNERFVSIKVDREERPDLDAVYMEAVQALTGRGGWPLSVWLTPDGTPFFGGTYFPPTARHGLPSFRQVLEAIALAWEARRADLAQTAEAVHSHLAEDGIPQPGTEGTCPDDYGPLLAGVDAELHAAVDLRDGGWGGAPKFPQPLVLEYLLARQTVEPQPSLELDIEVTLDAMAAGGMYDHIGGGFHRYSTDGYWLVPHFEKMLYDNAQLARCYLHAWQYLGKPRYLTVTVETLDYLLREMRHPEGGFFSAEDADTSEGEGAYFTWTADELHALLDPDEAAAIERAYGVTDAGNFEGRNILHLPRGFPTPGEPESASLEILDRARAKLRSARESRPRPARDDKILAGWNGLAIAALADTASALSSPVYREAAERAGAFILQRLTSPAGAGTPDVRLFHSWTGGRISGEAFLDGYACVSEGLLALYACTFDEGWFESARNLADTVLERFARPGGGFYDTSLEHEALITRPRAVYDSPTPSGTAMAATVLLKLAAYTGEDRYRERAEEALGSLAATADAAPVMSGQWLSAALLAHEGTVEAAIVGELDHPTGRALLAAARDRFRPRLVLAAGERGARSAVPLWLHREPAAGVPVAPWVCRRSTRAPPTSDAQDLARLLDTGSSRSA